MKPRMLRNSTQGRVCRSSLIVRALTGPPATSPLDQPDGCGEL
jgi:hypothetical protein